ERGDHVVEGVGLGRYPLPVVDAKEGWREIVERFLPVRGLPDERVGIEPHQRAFLIIILAALPAAPRDRPARGDDRIVGRVLQRLPLAPRAVLENRDRVGELVTRLLPAPDPRT